MFNSDQSSPAAVLFIENNSIEKELLYSEFEALLDGFTPEKDWANREVEAIYMELDDSLTLRGTVFFLLSFDQDGWVEASWNLPLVNLVLRGQDGPDFGSGPVLVYSKSLCDEAKYQDYMWEPDLSVNSPQFSLLRNSAKANRLGFTKSQSSPSNTSPAVPVLDQTAAIQAQGQAMQQYMANLVTAQSGAADAIQVKYEQQLELLKKDYAEKASELQEQLTKSLQSLSNITSSNKKLRDNLAKVENKLSGVKEYYQLKIDNSNPEESAMVRSIKDHYSRELALKIKSVEDEFAEIISWRDTEISHRSEQETKLQQEIDRLSHAYQELLDNGVGDYLEKLSENGISFMLYRDIVGYVSIPVGDISLYMENPDAYVAHLCEVSEAVYKQWRQHCHVPVCQAQLNTGVCEKDVDLISDPRQFVPGQSDYCKHHQDSA